MLEQLGNPCLHPLRRVWEHAFSNNYDIAFDENRMLTAYDLVSSINIKQQALKEKNASDCLVYRSNTVEFISDFLACVYSGVNIIMPANGQTRTYQRVRQYADAVLGDFDDCIMTGFFADNSQELSGQPIPRAHDITITLYTSGSTGKPQAICRPLSSLMAEVEAIESLWGNVVNHSVVLSTVSHQHIYGLLFKVLWPLSYARLIWGNIIPFEENLTYLIEKFDSCALISSPAFLTRLNNHLKKTKNKLRCVFSSGGPLLSTQAQQVENLLNTQCIRVFGSTETGGVAYQYSDTNEWTALPGVSLREQDGVLQVLSEYCYQDSWYSMSDQVSFNEKNQSPCRFTLLGRVDDIVKIEEKRVSLKEVENTLMKHQWVEQAKVFVLPKKRKCLGAVLVLNESGKQEHHHQGTRAFFKALQHFLSQYFEAVTLPKYVRYVAALPENSQGKIEYEKLLALFNQARTKTSDE